VCLTVLLTCACALLCSRLQTELAGVLKIKEGKAYGPKAALGLYQEALHAMRCLYPPGYASRDIAYSLNSLAGECLGQHRAKSTIVCGNFGMPVWHWGCTATLSTVRSLCCSALNVWEFVHDFFRKACVFPVPEYRFHPVTRHMPERTACTHDCCFMMGLPWYDASIGDGPP
jgi:hypothetical protein